MKSVLRRRLKRVISGAIGASAANHRALMLSGLVAARQVRQIEHVNRLADVEFGVFSQWGEDGILDWLIHHYGDIPNSFIEFGVENYVESNTRFLLQSRNWRGLVLDGDQGNIDYIKSDDIYWKYDLDAVKSFIDRDNINSTISNSGFSGEIGVLSVDIDGNDYWVLDAISCINPHIIVSEYNSTFGDIFPITVPYRGDFVRSEAHSSNIYYGASIRALEHLIGGRGYTLVGCNLAGSNAFFVRTDRVASILERIQDVGAYPARIRESRGVDGRMTFVAPERRASVINDCLVENVLTGDIAPLGALGKLESKSWDNYYSGIVR